ncbi:MAG: hypothetical protein DIU78_003715 [Pseudomonadota bacterium]
MLGWAALASALILGGIQWLFLPSFVRSALSPAVRTMGLPLLLSGAALVWAALAALGAWGIEGAFRLLRRRTAHAPRWLFAGVSVLALPYAIGLSLFTYSGPRVRDLWYRPALVVVTTLLVAACFGAWALSVVWFRLRRRTRVAFAASCFVAGVALVAVNAFVLPNEYEPIHRFVSAAVVLLLVAAADHGLDLRRWRRRAVGRRGRLVTAAPWSIAVLAAAVSVWLGATRETLAGCSGEKRPSLGTSP